MWTFLRNAKFATALGFLILIALIWLVGPYVGLDSRETRLLWIVGLMVVLVVALIAGRLISERASALLEKVLRHQTDDAVIGASAEQRRDVAQLRQRLLGAIDTLKTSRLGKVSGKAALYELPWYMIIGHPAAGKSSAILSSGLDFPFGDKQAVRGVGGTRNCDWFFTTEGVLLDTAGRYSTQREDRPEWLEFLKLLKKYRSKAPSNGIVVAISFTVRNEADPDRKDLAMGLTRDALARLQLRRPDDIRRPDEIPSVPGLCTKLAFIPNSEDKQERVSAAFDFRDHPDVLLIIRTDTQRSPNGPQLLERQKRTMSRIGPSAAYIRFLRQGDRDIGSLKGQEVLLTAPGDAGMVGHSFAWESPGKARPNNPFISIELETAEKNGAIEGRPASLTDREAVALWDAILNSFRPRVAQ